jgi:hypothetical protein
MEAYDMKMRSRTTHGVIAAAMALFGAAALSPGSAAAQDLSDQWKFSAFIYMWAPQITSSVTFPGGPPPTRT